MKVEPVTLNFSYLDIFIVPVWFFILDYCLLVHLGLYY